MKNPFVLSVVIWGTIQLTATAQQFQIDWFTMDGGGGISTGGAYTLSGTIGQPDAGVTMTGGTYQLTGGFWAAPFPTGSGGAPTLAIEPFGSGQVQLSWTVPAPGFLLQETPSLNSPNWVNSPSGASNPAIVPAGSAAKFYRLLKP